MSGEVCLFPCLVCVDSFSLPLVFVCQCPGGLGYGVLYFTWIHFLLDLTNRKEGRLREFPNLVLLAFYAGAVKDALIYCFHGLFGESGPLLWTLFCSFLSVAKLDFAFCVLN